MIWKSWRKRPLACLRIEFGLGSGSLIRCINLLVQHRVQLIEMKADDKRPLSLIGPTAIEVTLRHPGRRKIEAVISALNRSNFVCREEVAQHQPSGRNDQGMKRNYGSMLMLLFVVSGFIGAFGQVSANSTEAKATPSPAHLRLVGYLAGREPGFLQMLPPYPEFNSMQDGADITTLWQWQHPDNSRRQLANTDEEMSYNRFSEAFGMEINGISAPFLMRLLDRAERDVQDVAFNAKSFYNRPRPFQRFQLAHVCGIDKPPAPEVPLKGGSSYPSGHMSFGWAIVLILAEVAPERAQQLLARGQEYGESRVVCAMHYPSDVVGGELVATAVVARLHADPEFNLDLDCARQEHAVEKKPGEKLTATCEVRKAQLLPK